MSSRQNIWSKALDWVEDILAWIAGICIVAMMLAISYSVIARFVFNAPQPAVIELSGYLLLYTTFLGVPWLLRNDGHVKVDLLISKLGPRARRVFDTVTSVFGLVVALVLLWRGVLVTIDFYARGMKVFNILATPQYILLAVIPVGSLLLAFEFGRRMYRFARGREEKPARLARPAAGDGEGS
jgi:TRAP-type C4-dicarboxylate transport system permease small subunit